MKVSFFAAAIFLFAGTALAEPVGLPKVYSWPAASLAKAKERLKNNDEALAPALAELKTEAEKALALKPTSVMDKAKVAVSGDKHDYFSLAPYFWPDPANPKGPYIRKDGDVYPESKKGTDSVALGRTCGAVETLGLAYYFTGYEPYAEKAVLLTRIWFLDPATAMNPNLQYAQAITGVNDGRGIGILEARHLAGLTDGLTLLAGSPAWTAADKASLTKWLEAYYKWMRESEHGHDEANQKNNHGSWFDAQAAHLAAYLHHDADAKQIVEQAKHKRIDVQVEPNGEEPFEMVRTKSLDYSIFNLEALSRLALVGETVGVDLWGYTGPDGRSMKLVLHHLAPYADPDKKWPKDDLVKADRARLYPLFAQVLRHGDDSEFRSLLQQYGLPRANSARWRLIFAE